MLHRVTPLPVVCYGPLRFLVAPSEGLSAWPRVWVASSPKNVSTNVYAVEPADGTHI